MNHSLDISVFFKVCNVAFVQDNLNTFLYIADPWTTVCHQRGAGEQVKNGIIIAHLCIDLHL